VDSFPPNANALGQAEARPVDAAEETTRSETVTPASRDAANDDAPTTEELVATVNGSAITRHEWQQATRLDAVMSQMALQPVPTAEETLDRLVNEILVLETVADPASPDTARIEARLELLAGAWQVSDETIIRRLEAAGLSRDDLVARIGRLLQVEAALEQLTAEQDDLNPWLLAARAESEISLYRSLADQEPDTVGVEVTQPPAEVPDVEPEAEESVALFAPPTDMPFAPYPENAAPDFTLPALDGAPLTLSTLRGKPVIINFWATWCPPCRRELPALQAAFETYQDQIGFVAVDVKESPDKVVAFVDELGLTFPVVTDEAGQVSDVAYEVRGIPTTFFVDANGVIVTRHVGPLDEADIDRYLEPLLAAPAADENGAVSMIDTNGVEVTVGPETTTADDDIVTGKMAPDFALPTADGSPVSLRDFRNNSNLVLVFYRGHT
jgi:cytochrome c biogenesis protein CcmG/thiol:disulfide interchange protein DsbE